MKERIKFRLNLLERITKNDTTKKFQLGDVIGSWNYFICRTPGDYDDSVVEKVWMCKRNFCDLAGIPLEFAKDINPKFQRRFVTHVIATKDGAVLPAISCGGSPVLSPGKVDYGKSIIYFEGDWYAPEPEVNGSPRSWKPISVKDMQTIIDSKQREIRKIA